MKTLVFAALFSVLATSAHAEGHGALDCSGLALKAMNQLAQLNESRTSYDKVLVDVASGDLKIAFFNTPDNKFRVAVTNADNKGCAVQSMSVGYDEYTFGHLSSNPKACEDLVRESLMVFSNLNGEKKDGSEFELSAPVQDNAFRKFTLSWFTPGKKIRVRSLEESSFFASSCRITEVDYDAYGMHP